jgi:hypothetical protein
MRKFLLAWICLGFALLAPAICSPAAAAAFVPKSALAQSQKAVTLIDGYRYQPYHRHHSYYGRRPLTYSYPAPREYYVVPAYHYYAPPVVYLPPPVYEYAPSDSYCAPPAYAYSYERRCCEGW